MSGPFALAAVSDVLRCLLARRLKDPDQFDLSIFGGQAADVTIQPPDRVQTGDNEAAQLNLFLYRVVPNAALRNEGLPARSASGERLSNPLLALDLHYLLTAYGSQPLHQEALLGYGMQVLHETPFLSRQFIRDTWSADGGDKLQEMLARSGLAEQIEYIKIVPETLSTEELSKLWTAFQAKYRPSAAFLLTVVIIQAHENAKTPLPVLRRGKEGRGPVAQPDLIPPFPTIERIDLPNRQISAQLEDQVTLVGHHLAGGGRKVLRSAVQLVSSRLEKPIIVKQFVGQPIDQQVIITIPAQAPRPPAGTPADEDSGTRPETGPNGEPPSEQEDAFYPAGFYRLSVEMTVSAQKTGPEDPETPEETLTSNGLPLLVAPRIVSVNGMDLPRPPELVSVQRENVHNGFGDATLIITCTPQVLPEQPVSLILGDRKVIAEDHPKLTATVTFKVKRMAAGTYRLRLRVDDVDSLLVNRSDDPPRFDEAQQVILT